MADSATQLVADILSGILRPLDIPADTQAAAEATYDAVGLLLGDNLDSEDHSDRYGRLSRSRPRLRACRPRPPGLVTAPEPLGAATSAFGKVTQ